MLKKIVMISLLYCASIFASAAASAASTTPTQKAPDYPKYTYLTTQPQMMAGFIPKSLIFNFEALAAIAAVKQVQGIPLVAIDAPLSEIPRIKRALPHIEAAFKEKLFAKFGKGKPEQHHGYLLTRAGEVEPVDENFAVELRYGGVPMVASIGPVSAPGEPESQTALHAASKSPQKNGLMFPKYPCFVGFHPGAQPPFPLNVPTAELNDVYKTFDNVMNTFRLKFAKTCVDPKTKEPKIETHGYLFMPNGEIIPTNYTELLLFGRVTFTGRDIERVNRFKAQEQTVAMEPQTAAALAPQVAGSPDFKALAEAALLEKQRQEKELKELQDEHEAQEKAVQECLKYDYMVIPILGKLQCQPQNAPKEEHEKIEKHKSAILMALLQKFAKKFNRKLDSPYGFKAQGDIQPLIFATAKIKSDDAISKTVRRNLRKASGLSFDAIVNKALKQQQQGLEAAEAKKKEAERLQAAQEELSKQRKAEKNKKKRQKAKQKAAQSQIPVASSAPASSGGLQVSNVLPAEALLEKERREKEAAANKKEAERLLVAQQALIKQKLAQKQKKQEMLYAHAAGEEADTLVDELAECDKQFVRIKKFGTLAEKTELAEKYQTVAGRLAKLNHEKSAEAQAKYDELQKALKGKVKK